MRFEQVAVEKGNMCWRAAVERAEVFDDPAPKGIFGRADAVRARICRRFVMQFHRLLMRAASDVIIAGVLTPRLNNALQGCTGVNIAVFADAEKQDAVNDALAGFRQFVTFQQFVVIVIFVNVGGKVAPVFIEKFQKVIVQRASAIGLDEPLLAGLGGAGGTFGQRIQRRINAAGVYLIAGEQVPNSRASSGYCRKCQLFHSPTCGSSM